MTAQTIHITSSKRLIQPEQSVAILEVSADKRQTVQIKLM